MMMEAGDAQHSTAVKSIGSIISRGSIIVVLPLFFDFCKEWVELPLWGRWNCTPAAFFDFWWGGGGGIAPLPLFFRFF